MSLNVPRARVATNLADPGLYAHGDPEAVWRGLRKACPMYWNATSTDSGFWAVTRYEDVASILKNTSDFTSTMGIRLDHEPRATAAAADNMLIVTDPPKHPALRRVMNSAFTPRMISRLEANMVETVSAELDAALEKGEVDFVETASVLPSSVISDMLGVPREDWTTMRELTQRAFGVNDGGVGDSNAVAAHTEILLYYSELAESKRRNPSDDVVSALVHGSIDGRPLTDDEIFLNCDGLLLGGNETTKHAAAAGFLALIERPEEWRKLRSEPAFITSAVEEILRWSSPGMAITRHTRRPITFVGQEIGEGETVSLWIGSANRDERVFAHPDVFDIARQPNHHLALGIGQHYCLGSSLARLELTVFFQQLCERISSAAIRGSVTRLRSVFIRGFDSMPVALEGF